MNFSTKIIQWQQGFGRHHLPWQKTHDPYRIWLSEIMLQQTQVQTVLGYYQRFLDAYPTVVALAHAEHDEVMALWAGLGYYARARNLHQCAKIIAEQYEGKFPTSAEILMQLPGIGRSTASAIAAFAFGERSPILDGNVKRVFARHFGIEGDVTKSAIEKRLWEIAYQELPVASANIHQEMIAYTQGLMDLGSGPCKKSDPSCLLCPVQTSCIAFKEARQQELPSPKARKIIPVKTTHMLLITNQHGEVMVEPRPSPGIWGGLWSLPECTEQEISLVANKLGADITQLQQFLEFRHTFSHYHLDITVWRAPAKQNILNDNNHQWLATQEPLALGIPKPVQTILKKLKSS